MARLLPQKAQEGQGAAQLNPWKVGEGERTTNWPKLAQARFDEFNVDSGKPPAEFELGGRRFEASVRFYGTGILKRRVSRSIVITESRKIAERNTRVLAGFANDLYFQPPTGMILAYPEGLISGNRGWIGTYDYNILRREISEIGRGSRMGFETAYRIYYQKLEESGNRRHDIAMLDNLETHLEEHVQERFWNDMESVIREGGDCRMRGGIFKKIFEFAYLLCPQEANWTLRLIGRPRTSRQLKASKPFSETSFGLMIEEAGWAWRPPVLEEGLKLYREQEEELRTSPVVSKIPGFQPKGWLGIDRFRQLTETL